MRRHSFSRSRSSLVSLLLVVGTFGLATVWAGCAAESAVDAEDPGGEDASSKDGSSDTGSTDAGSSDADTEKDAASTAVCGDGKLGSGEGCDDGNTSAGDGCSASCTVEPGFDCPDGVAGACGPICGNNIVQAREACDPAGGGCSATCSIQLGFTCGEADGGVSCSAVCGDGVVSGAETCDEGPLNGEPSHCNETCSATITLGCGDGRIQAGEGCDDGASNGQAGACPAGCPMASVPLPAHGGPYGSMVRGYFFTAPEDFVITSLRVPTDASGGEQNIAVLRLPAPPPLYAGVTNDFETLFLAQKSAEPNAIAVRLPVSKDDVIVVLGNRDNTNSYSSGGPHTSNINGHDVTLGRCGMQFSLSDTAPRDIWREDGGSISRVEITTALSQCGDGVRVKGSEGCDDGNLADGDGCSSTCTVEQGYACSEGTNGLATSACTSTCGDSAIASNEACDDGGENGTAGKCPADCSGFVLDTGTHASVSNAGTRGFWFTAPTSFVLRSVQVPAEAGAGNQAFEIVKLLEDPPANGTATNAFQTLASGRAIDGSTVTKVRVAVKAGDRIGILGGRGAAAALTSSLSSAAVSATVKGQTMPLFPLSTAGSLDTAPATNLRAGAAGPIGRVDVRFGD